MVKNRGVLGDETPSSASFIAITRTREGEVELFVEVHSLVHKGLYHAIGGKAEAGETGHDTINRELEEECELDWPRSEAHRPPWKRLGDSDLLGRTYHPGAYKGEPVGFRSYYLYPEEVSEVWGKGIHAGWVPLETLSALNSTSALQELVGFLNKSHPTVGSLSFKDLEEIRRIQLNTAPASRFTVRASDDWDAKVDGVHVRVHSWWTRELEHLDSNGRRVFREEERRRPTSAWESLIRRLSAALDRRVTFIVRSILRGDTELAAGLAEIATSLRMVLSQVSPVYTYPVHRQHDGNAIRLEGFGASGMIDSRGGHEDLHNLAGWPFGLADGLEVLLKALE